ncbi:MAG: hypothetical protein ACRDGV_11460 [Candidatus Limnocylindria bacterium]
MFPTELTRVILEEREREIEDNLRVRCLLGRRGAPMRPFDIGARSRRSRIRYALGR